MKKLVLMLGILCGFAGSAMAQEMNLQELDSQARMERPNTNSIMFRRNADQYRQLSDDEKADIAERREQARKIRLQQEEFARRKAMKDNFPLDQIIPPIAKDLLLYLTVLNV